MHSEMASRITRPSWYRALVGDDISCVESPLPPTIGPELYRKGLDMFRAAGPPW